MIAFLAATSLFVAPLPPLTCQGTKLVDPTGREVRLRGVNLGGWFVEEMWMTPWAEVPQPGSGSQTVHDSVSLWSTLERRLGAAAMVRLRDAWRDNWITDADFGRIKAAGFDHVRIPFQYTLLDQPKGLARLHHAVDAAAAAGLYTVLDLHGAPGRQSGDHVTGERGSNRLWFDVENITKMEQLWAKLGQEFGANPNVAMFDLMNEPTGAPNPAMLHLVYDRVIRAVRKTAPTKVLLVDDGYKGFETTPHPNLANWTNVAFSLHFYTFDAKDSAEHLERLIAKTAKTKELQGNRNAPLYIGEFNLEPHGTPGLMRDYTRHLTASGWSWALWTYKTDGKNGPMGQWGLYRRAAKPDPIDPFKETEAQIMAKIRGVRTENFEPVPGLIPALTSAP